MRDLQGLKARFLYAHTKGYAIAWAKEYVEDLGGGEPPPGVEANSPEHLLYLVSLLEAQASAPVTLVTGTLPAMMTEAPPPPEAPAEAPAEEEAEPVTVIEPIVIEPKKAKKGKK